MSLISSTTVTGMDDDLDCNVSELLATIPSVDNVKLPNLEKIKIIWQSQQSGQRNL